MTMILSLRPASRRPASHLIWLALVAGLALPLGACDSNVLRAVVGGPTDPVGDMFATGYDHIDTVFIRSTPLSEVAFAGIEGLSVLDPRLAVAKREGKLALLVDGKIVRLFDQPGANDADAWGSVTSQAVAKARDVSLPLRQASNEDVYEVVFDGMISQLDDFSRYASAKEATENRASREGFGGIGVRIEVGESGARIISVMHYAPADQIGLRANDIIAEADGRPLSGLTQEQVIDILRGPIGSKLRLTVLRGEPAQRLPFLVVRAHVVPETVTYRREGDVGYFRIYSFNLETAESLRKEIVNAKREIGPGIKGYILDLRGNPGGLLDQAVAVSDLFLDDGRIVSTHGRHPDSHQYFEASDGDIGEGRPVVVLVNGNSASASEIVASALQDDARAVVIGSNSYGKGTVQTVLRMPNDGELTLTWARFHAPSGYTLNHLGVLPTLCTDRMAAGNGAELVMETLRRNLIPALPTVARNATDPDDEAALSRLRAACPASTEEHEADIGLALRLIHQPSLFDRALALAVQPDIAATSAATGAGANP